MPSETKNDFLAVRFPASILEQLDQHGDNRSEAVRDSLARYFALLDAARRGLAGRFTEGECGLMLDVLNGICFPEASPLAENPLLSMEIGDVEAEVFAKWGADKSVLVEKLSALTATEQVALVDAVERWWRASKFGFTPQVGELLK